MRTSLGAKFGLVLCFMWGVLGACSFDSSKLDKGECQTNEDCAFNETCVDFTCVSTQDDVVDESTQSQTSCGLNTCESGQTCCDYACTNVKTDTQNCGGCGIACAGNEVCSDGVCECGQTGFACTGVAELCCGEGADTASCTNIRGNTAHCGGCGLSCRPSDQTIGSVSELCAQGACVCRTEGGSLEQCTSDQTCCADAGCVDLQTNAAHCGGCGVACGAGEACEDGQCVCEGVSATGGPACDAAAGLQCCGAPAACVSSNDPQCFCGDTKCSGDQLCCADDGAQRCVNSDRDVMHCGVCGRACGDGEVCSDGQCIVECQAGLIACRVDGQARCIDPLTSNQFCGAKGLCEGTNPAFTDYAGQTCGDGTVCNGSGQCEVTCLPGMVACDIAGEITCVDPLIDSRACGAEGACNSADPGSANYEGEQCAGGGQCAGGSCACPGLLAECGGVCVDPQTDSAHCGAAGLCNSSVPGGPNYSGVACGDGQRCAGGQCVCAPGLVFCGGRCADPDTDMQFCGANASCQGATACSGIGKVCAGGACVCAAGLISCGGQCIDPRTDRDRCGAKGTCVGTDPSAANFQGLDCANGTICNGSGACTLSCAQGLVLCNGECVDPDNDPTRCGARGACTNASSANPDYQGATCNTAIGQVCAGGTCQCAGGRILCGGRCVDPQTDLTYCGAAANCSGADVCTLGEVCTAGVCACGTGLIRCGGQCIDPQTHPAYCGAFADCSNARVCVPGAQCVTGACLCGGSGQVCSTFEGSSCTGANCVP